MRTRKQVTAEPHANDEPDFRHVAGLDCLWRDAGAHATMYSSLYSLETATMPLVIRLSHELDSALRSLSAEERVSRAEFVRRLIRERMAARKAGKTAYQIARELGVIGMDDDPRRDVARNHSKYVRAALRGKRTS